MIRLAGSGSFTETVPVLDEQGHMSPAEVERELAVDVALRWTTGYDTVSRSFVNVIATPKGGTHVTGFERALVRTLNEQLRAARLLKNGDEPVTKDDAAEGLAAVISESGCRSRSSRARPKRCSARQRRPASSPAGGSSERLREFFTSRGKAKPQARGVLEKVASAARARIAAREHRDNQRRKSALAASTLPAKLVDCRSSDDRSELFIVEGDSALGTAKLARDSEFQALLPIRGKILNVQKASLSDMLKNAECAAVIQVIGAGSGASFDLDAARYQRVIILSDADVDGAHIRTLLLTLFHRYLHPMLEAGRVFAAVPPLHRVELSSPRKGQQKYIYTYTDGQLTRTLLELERKGQRWKEPPQRYKGLGEMDAGQLAAFTMDPRHRMLRRVRVEDTTAASAMFDLLMGSEVGPRRDFIVSGAARAGCFPDRRLRGFCPGGLGVRGLPSGLAQHCSAARQSWMLPGSTSEGSGPEVRGFAGCGRTPGGAGTIAVLANPGWSGRTSTDPGKESRTWPDRCCRYGTPSRPRPGRCPRVSGTSWLAAVRPR